MSCVSYPGPGRDPGPGQGPGTRTGTEEHGTRNQERRGTRSTGTGPGTRAKQQSNSKQQQHSGQRAPTPYKRANQPYQAKRDQPRHTGAQRRLEHIQRPITQIKAESGPYPRLNRPNPEHKTLARTRAKPGPNPEPEPQTASPALTLSPGATPTRPEPARHRAHPARAAQPRASQARPGNNPMYPEAQHVSPETPNQH